MQGESPDGTAQLATVCTGEPDSGHDSEGRTPHEIAAGRCEGTGAI